MQPVSELGRSAFQAMALSQGMTWYVTRFPAPHQRIPVWMTTPTAMIGNAPRPGTLLVARRVRAHEPPARRVHCGHQQLTASTAHHTCRPPVPAGRAQAPTRRHNTLM